MDDLNQVCRLFGLDTISVLGTLGDNKRSNTTTLIESSRGLYVLREHKRTNSRQAVEVEHLVLQSLSQELPVAPPIPALSGDTITELNDKMYALFNFVYGSPFVFGDARLVKSSAAMLGTFHQQMKQLALNVSREGWGSIPNYDWICRNHNSLTSLIESAACSSDIDIANALCILDSWLDVVNQELVSAGIDRTLIHGDWIPANLKYGFQSEVRLICDFDNMRHEIELLDLGTAVIFCRDNAWVYHENLLETYIEQYQRAYRNLSGKEMSLLLYAMISRLIQAIIWYMDALVVDPSAEQPRIMMRRRIGAIQWLISLNWWK